MVIQKQSRHTYITLPKIALRMNGSPTTPYEGYVNTSLSCLFKDHRGERAVYEKHRESTRNFPPFLNLRVISYTASLPPINAQLGQCGVRICYPHAL